MTRYPSANSKLTLPMAITIGIKAIVGVGLFTAPSALQVVAGPAGILTYVLVSAAALCMALAIARLAQLYPEKGVFYTYTKAWGGHFWGTVATSSYMIGLIIALGLLAYVAGGIYLHAYVPSISPAALSVALIALVVGAHLAGAEIAKTGQKVLLVLTYIPILLIILLCLFKADVANLTPFFPHGWTSVFTAVPYVIFGFFGFEAIPSLFNDIENPERNVPKAIVWTMIIVGLTYILFAGSIFLGLPRHFFVSARTPLSAALLPLYPQLTWLVACIDWTIIIAIVGVLHAMIWSLSSLAIDTSEYILRRSSHVSKKAALLLIGGSVMLSCLLFNNAIDLMFLLTAIFITLAQGLSMLALILQPRGRSSYQIAIACMGICVSLLIFGCALAGVVQALG